MKRSLARPAVFGAFDGTASLLGVVVYLLVTHPALIFPAALSGAISSALSMGAGEWLSDNDSGPAAAAVTGAATFTGALLPAVPFAFSTGPAAVAECGVICVMLAVAVAAMRPVRSLPLALAETLGLMTAIFAATVLCGLFLPGGAS